MDCPFYPKIERKTDWYLEDVVNSVVACEDLNPKKFKYRILVVGWGPQWHRDWEAYTREERHLLVELAHAIARYHIKIGKAKELVGIDTEHFKFPEHGHVQAEMR